MTGRFSLFVVRHLPCLQPLPARATEQAASGGQQPLPARVTERGASTSTRSRHRAGGISTTSTRTRHRADGERGASTSTRSRHRAGGIPTTSTRTRHLYRGGGHSYNLYPLDRPSGGQHPLPSRVSERWAPTSTRSRPRAGGNNLYPLATTSRGHPFHFLRPISSTTV
jgi:hypothetical protein